MIKTKELSLNTEICHLKTRTLTTDQRWLLQYLKQAWQF